MIIDITSIAEMVKELEWQDEGLCSQIDPELFYLDDPKSVAAAKKICGDCGVRSKCLQFAIDNDELYGVWGGMTRQEREITGAA